MTVITRPTHIAGTSCTLIDIIFVSSYGNAKSGILTICITDHLPIFSVYGSYFQSSYVSPQSIKVRVINEHILNNFYSSFESMNFPEFLQYSDVNRAPETLDAKIFDCHNQCCPIKTEIISVKDQLKPRITR